MTKNSYASQLLLFDKQLSFSGVVTENLSKLYKKKIQSVIVVGVGGSGLSGDIINIFRKEIKIPVRIYSHKNYGIPEDLGRDTLLIFSSFSGETEETLSGVRDAIKKNFPVGIVAGGGNLLSLAKRMRLPYASFSGEGLTPREAVGYNCYSVLSLLLACFPKIKIQELSSKIYPENLLTQGKEISLNIGGKIPLIYAEERLSGLLGVWKTNLNETGKKFVSVNYIPEMNHNEITAIKDIKNAVALFLEDTDASSIIKKRIQASKTVFKKQHIPVIRIILSGKTVQEKIWNNIILSHWTALFVAKQKKTDPRKTLIIDTLKKTLST